MKVSSFHAVLPFAATSATRPVLVVENDADQRRRVVTQLSNWGYNPLAAGSAEEALELLGRARFVFSLVAIRLPGLSGIELIRRAPELAESGPVIMVADTGHSAQIVEAIQAGADDFIRRPYTAEDLEHAIRTVAGRARRETAPPIVDDNGERLQREFALLVSPPMRDVLQVIEQAARADVTVLVCGETGVGKEVVARAIHAHSPRRRPCCRLTRHPTPLPPPPTGTPRAPCSISLHRTPRPGLGQRRSSPAKTRHGQAPRKDIS